MLTLTLASLEKSFSGLLTSLYSHHFPTVCDITRFDRRPQVPRPQLERYLRTSGIVTRPARRAASCFATFAPRFSHLVLVHVGNFGTPR